MPRDKQILTITNEATQAGETAKEYAYRIIKENIITLELEPGSTLNDMEISQMIGISRTPVREAIIKLKEESDIIEIFPQRGMRIALIDTDIVQEVRGAGLRHGPGSGFCVAGGKSYAAGVLSEK